MLFCARQFDCNNTLNDQLLENVSVVVEAEEFDILLAIPCPKLEYSVPGVCYVALEIPESIPSCTGKLLI